MQAHEAFIRKQFLISRQASGYYTLCGANKRIIAKWLINNEQEQFGTGFFKNNILIINFKYVANDHSIFKGVVVYTCLSKNILDGFWSEKHGNLLFLGEERCFRKQEQPKVIN